MKLLIGEKIRKYRYDRNLTQEEVANHLGISFQSVSKWERGDGYPDITFLPALARYFDITVDELLGMNEIASSERLEGIHSEWEHNRKAHKHRENVLLMKNALKSYPNNPLLLVQLSASLERIKGTPEEEMLNLKESIKVQEQILTYTDDEEIRGAVLFNIADSYLRAGDREKALEYALKLPNFYKTRENALIRILDDENEKHAVAQESIERIIWSLITQMTVLAETEREQNYFSKMIRIIDIVYEDSRPYLIDRIRLDLSHKKR